MTHRLQQLAAWLGPWLTAAQAQRALARLDVQLAEQLPLADSVWRARSLACLSVALPAAAVLPELAPACMRWCRAQLPSRSEPAIRSAGTVLIRDSSSTRVGAVRPLSGPLHENSGSPAARGRGRPATWSALGTAREDSGSPSVALRRRPAADDLQRWASAVESEAAIAAADVHRWPPQPTLAGAPPDVCVHLAHLLRQGPLPPVAATWLEWILHRLEQRGHRAGWDRRLQQLRFGVGPALMLVVQAWHAQRDPRFVNTLLRVGDGLLANPHRLRDVEARAALVASVLTREAALARWEMS